MNSSSLLSSKIVYFFFTFLLVPIVCEGQVKETILSWENPPIVGKAIDGAGVSLGGLSGICCASVSNGNLVFAAITDRGPNAEAIKDWAGVGEQVRPFVLPSYHPEILRLSVQLRSNTWKILERTSLKATDGTPLTGLPSHAQGEGNRKIELAVTTKGEKLGIDSTGTDSEGFCLAEDGSYWVGEEYGPDLIHIDKSGKTIDRFEPGKGLPKILESRKPNRGFEGVACANKLVYAIVQSPLVFKDEKNHLAVRIVEFDPAKKETVGMYLYVLKSEKTEKVSELLHFKDKKFLTIEQNGKSGKSGKHFVFEVDLEGARNLIADPLSIEPELMSEEALRALKNPKKRLVLDLSEGGLAEEEKLEGLGIVEGKTLLVLTDNDFGFSGEIEKKSGHAAQDPKKKTKLGIYENAL